jgi:hypothetical protein
VTVLLLDRPPNMESRLGPSVYARGRVCDELSEEKGIGVMPRVTGPSFAWPYLEGRRMLEDWVPRRKITKSI